MNKNRFDELEQIKAIINSAIDNDCFSAKGVSKAIDAEAETAWDLLDAFHCQPHSFSVYEEELEALQHAYEAMNKLNDEVGAGIKEDTLKVLAECVYEYDKRTLGVCAVTAEVLIDSLIRGAFRTEYIAEHAEVFDEKYSLMTVSEINADLKRRALEMHEFLVAAVPLVDTRRMTVSGPAQYKEYIQGELEDIAVELGCAFFAKQYVTMAHAYTEVHSMFDQAA